MSWTGTEALGTRMLLERRVGDGCGAFAGAVASEAVPEWMELGRTGRCRGAACLDDEALASLASSDDSTMSMSISPWRLERGEARERGSPVRGQSFEGWGFGFDLAAACFFRRELPGPP